MTLSHSVTAGNKGIVNCLIAINTHYELNHEISSFSANCKVHIHCRINAIYSQCLFCEIGSVLILKWS